MHAAPDTASNKWRHRPAPACPHYTLPLPNPQTKSTICEALNEGVVRCGLARSTPTTTCVCVQRLPAETQQNLSRNCHKISGRKVNTTDTWLVGLRFSCRSGFACRHTCGSVHARCVLVSTP
jgi:hypothetical protein